MAEGARLELAQHFCLADFRDRCPTSWASPRMHGGERQIRTVAATGLGALAVRWTPRSSFPLRVADRGFEPREVPLRRRGSVRRSRRPLSGPRRLTRTAIVGLEDRGPSVERSGGVGGRCRNQTRISRFVARCPVRLNEPAEVWPSRADSNSHRNLRTVAS
jgi:hypothetical protein